MTIYKVIRIDGSESPFLFIIIPGKKIIKTWITQELVSEERIRLIIIGYTNNEITLEYLNHLILHLRAGPLKPWKILLLNNHESHKTDAF